MDWKTYDKRCTHAIEIRTALGDAPLLPPAGAPVFGLYLLSEGELTLRLDGSRLTIQAPCLFARNERTALELLCARNAAVRSVLFHPTFLNVNMTLPLLRSHEFTALADIHCLFQLELFLQEKMENAIFRPPAEIFSFMQHCFDCMHIQLQEQPDFYWSCRTRSYFMDLLSALERLRYSGSMQTEWAARDSLLLQNVLAHMEAHLEENLSLTEICRKFSVGRNKLETLFYRSYGCTFAVYLRRMRLDRICHYLRFTELSLSEIAMRTGFSTSQNLARFFRREMQDSPAHFRKQAVAQRKQAFSHAEPVTSE